MTQHPWLPAVPSERLTRMFRPLLSLPTGKAEAEHVWTAYDAKHGRLTDEFLVRKRSVLLGLHDLFCGTDVNFKI